MANPFAFGGLDVDPLTNEVAAEAWAPQMKDKVARGLVQGLGNMIATPGRAMRDGITTEQATDWAAPLAMGMVGMGRFPGAAPEGAVVGSGGAKLVQPEGIRAYHGSPHDFDRFDLSKIGTGEGAQAYGHGLYFAENPKVATDYRNRLADLQAPSFYNWRGQEISGKSGPESHAVSLAYHDNPATARRIAKEGLDAARAGDPWAVEMGGIPYWEKMASVANEIRSKREISHAKGRMYEVNINASPDQLLDLNAPLSKQTAEGISPLLQQSLRDKGYLRPNDYGPRQLDAAMREFKLRHGGMAETPWEAALSPRGELLGTSPEGVSQRLLDAGIPGTKYFDEGSRSRSRGTRNYVMFDDSLVDIMRKYAIPGAVGGGAAFGSLAPGGDHGGY